ncbi:MAG: hypothetical protein ACTSRG_02775 [Candidatus Helarchaeota archaeon]
MAICVVCGKEVTGDGRKCGKCGKILCSDSCRREHRVNEHGFICANCGKKFISYRHIEDKESNVFCSEECFKNFKAITCDYCGEKFLGKYYFKNKDKKHKFCSKSCLEKFYSK